MLGKKLKESEKVLTQIHKRFVKEILEKLLKELQEKILQKNLKKQWILERIFKKKSAGIYVGIFEEISEKIPGGILKEF